MYYKGLKNRLVNYLSASFSAFCHYVSAANTETAEETKARVRDEIANEFKYRVMASCISRSF